MKSKVLPLIDIPPVIALQHHAFYLGVLFTNKDYVHHFHSSFVDFYYCNTINPNFNFAMGKYYSFEEYVDSIDVNCPLEETKLLELIMRMLNLGFYVSGVFNEFYVPKRKSTYNRNFDHDFLIYGISVESEELHIIGYTGKGLYEKSKIDFSSFCKAIYNTGIDKKWIRFFKIRDNYEFKFCILRLKEALCNYLSSTEVTLFNHDKDHEFYYGINAMEKFTQSITVQNPQRLRYYRIMLEHKKCMLLRVQYLTVQGLLESRKYEKECEKIAEIARIVFNKAIKYYLSPDFCNISEIKKLLLKMIELEKKILAEIFNCL